MIRLLCILSLFLIPSLGLAQAPNSILFQQADGTGKLRTKYLPTDSNAYLKQLFGTSKSIMGVNYVEGYEYLAAWQNLLITGNAATASIGMVGDSVMHGGQATTLGNSIVPIFKLSLKQSFSNLPIPANRGIPGMRITTWDTGNPSPLDIDIASAYKLYVVALGLNDWRAYTGTPDLDTYIANVKAAYIAALTRIRTEVGDVNSVSILLTSPSPADARVYSPPYTNEQIFSALSEMIREVARDQKCAFIDINRLYNDVFNAWFPADEHGAGNRLHPDDIYSMWYSDQLMDVIMPEALVYKYGTRSISKDGQSLFDITSATSANSALGSILRLRRSGGTLDVPTASLSGYVLGYLGETQGYDGSAWVTGARIFMTQTGTASPGQIPTRIDFATGDGSSLATRFRMEANGGIASGISVLNVTGADTRYAQLAAANVFTANQTVQGNNTVGWISDTAANSAAPLDVARRSRGTLTARTDTLINDPLRFFDAMGYANGAFKTGMRARVVQTGTYPGTGDYIPANYVLTLFNGTTFSDQFTFEGTGAATTGISVLNRNAADARYLAISGTAGLAYLAGTNTFTGSNVFKMAAGPTNVHIIGNENQNAALHIWEDDGDDPADRWAITSSSVGLDLVNDGGGLISFTDAGGITLIGGVFQNNSTTILNGDVTIDKTITPPGTTTTQIINKNAGSVNFPAAGPTITVINNRVSTSSVIQATMATDDIDMEGVVVTQFSGSFTLTAKPSAPMGEVRVNFLVTN